VRRQHLGRLGADLGQVQVVMHSVLAAGVMIAAPMPRAGQIAPRM
jgi:hypothetical protein